MVDDAGGSRPAGAKTSVVDHVILVVEDDALLRSTAAEFLRLSGFTVIEVPTAVEAIAELESGKSIDIVFSDVGRFGPMGGLGLAQWLHQRYPYVPIMLTSGYGGPVRQAALDLVGDEFFLSKPYRQERLADRIRRLLEASSEVVQVAASGSSKR
jgi:CheY-like chemotaxis protein